MCLHVFYVRRLPLFTYRRKGDYFMDREAQIREEEAQRIARNLVDSLAVEFISERTGVDISKVEEFRREYEKTSRK